jgi:hypothetical protein
LLLPLFIFRYTKKAVPIFFPKAGSYPSADPQGLESSPMGL